MSVGIFGYNSNNVFVNFIYSLDPWNFELAEANPHVMSVTCLYNIGRY